MPPLPAHSCSQYRNCTDEIVRRSPLFPRFFVSLLTRVPLSTEQIQIPFSPHSLPVGRRSKLPFPPPPPFFDGSFFGARGLFKRSFRATLSLFSLCLLRRAKTARPSDPPLLLSLDPIFWPCSTAIENTSYSPLLRTFAVRGGETTWISFPLPFLVLAFSPSGADHVIR